MPFTDKEPWNIPLSALKSRIESDIIGENKEGVSGMIKINESGDSFRKIRETNSYYVDKTEMLYKYLKNIKSADIQTSRTDLADNPIKLTNDTEENEEVSFNGAQTLFDSNVQETLNQIQGDEKAPNGHAELGSASQKSQETLHNTDTKTLKEEFETIKNQQGTIGNLWDGFKNLTGIGDSSDKVEKALDKFEKGEITKDEAQKVLEEYSKGQEMCVDVAADVISGIAAIGAFALAVPTGGTSLAAGLAISTAVGAGLKTGIKCADAKLNGREYNLKNAAYDSVTGGVNGVLAPVTNGLGNTVVKTIGTKLGLTITDEAAKETAKEGIKSTAQNILLNQSVDVEGGNLGKRAAALGAGMAVDGGVSGGVYGSTAAAMQGEDAAGILEAGLMGTAGGVVFSPALGGAFRAAGSLGREKGSEIESEVWERVRSE